MNRQKRNLASVLLGLILLVTFTGGLSSSNDGPPTLFTVYIGYSWSSPARTVIATTIRDSFCGMHIDAQIVGGTAGGWLDRILFPDASQLGATYEEGGWDVYQISWNFGEYVIDPSTLYDSSAIPLYNFILLNDSVNDAMLAEIRVTYNDTRRFELLKEWQAYIHDLSPSAILCYENRPFAIDPNWTGFENISYIFPEYGDPMVRHPLATKWVIGTTGDPQRFAPLFPCSGNYEKLAFAGVYESLFRYQTNEDLFSCTHTPALAAADWVISDDGLNWTLDLREDMFWPTGHQFNATDVIITWKAIVTPAVTSYLYSDYVTVGLNNASFDALGSHRVRVRFNETLGPYALARYLLNIPPLPSFALHSVPYAEWPTHPINNGSMWTVNDTNGDPYTCYGPMGLGPYVCNTPTSGWDEGSRSFVAYLRGSTNDAGLANGTKIPYFLGDNGYGQSPMPSTYMTKTIEGGTTPAISALKLDRIDLIDNDFAIMYEIDKLKPDWSREISYIEPRIHILGFNLHHPVFGTGVATPYGVSDPDNASLYAKYVRQALNYLVPRQEIIDQIWKGYAVLGVEALPPITDAFNSELIGYTYQPQMARLLLQMAGYVIPVEPIVLPIEVFLVLGVIVIVVEVIFVAFLLYQRRARQAALSKSSISSN